MGLRGRARWQKPSAEEKLAITAACQRLIADVLTPRYLPEIKPTKFNYPIAIYGKWHGTNTGSSRATARTERTP